MTYNLRTPFIIYFNQGINTITIANSQVAFLLGNVTLSPKEILPSAAEYSTEHAHIPQGPSEPIVIQGQHYTAKSQSYINPARSSNHNAYPYDPGFLRINALAEFTWREAGNFVEYTFSVPQDGMYYIVFRYRISTLLNQPSFRHVTINGKPLFEEMYNQRFAFTGSSYSHHPISANGKAVPVFLTAGTNVLRMETSADVYFEAHENLLRVIQALNALTIDVTFITGNRRDRFREWNIDEFIPNIREDLIHYAEILQVEFDRLHGLFGEGNNGEISNLLIAKNLLLSFADDLDMMVNNMDRLSQAPNSATELIAIVLPGLLFQPLELERIFVTGDLDSLPRMNRGFWSTIVEHIRQFFLTFTIRQDRMGMHDADRLNIWVGENMIRVEMMRERFREFTALTGIPVNISAMPDEQRLLLAASAGTGPDMVIGASSFRPFDFALRGALYDLRQFPDFHEILPYFHPEMFVPFIIHDSVYAVPQSIGFLVTYYRRDILERLDLEVPETWDDVIEMLPTLSRFGMVFNSPIANAGAMKHFGVTVPLILQHQGEIYAEDGSHVVFGHPNTVRAFRFMTDLYTRYALPESIPSFYNSFRRGVAPVGIGGLQEYFLFRFAAPELYGQWGMAPSVGVRGEDGVVRNYQTSVLSGNMIMANSNMIPEAWEAIKWWMSTEVQVNFANDLQLRFGSQFIHMTANMEAFAQMRTLPDEAKQVVLAQLENTREIPRNPAYFQVERSLSNAWNSVVFRGVSPRTALDTAIIESNREITRKLQEFGFKDDLGNLVTPFRTGTRELVESWMVP
jgi:ABC-type glycerol-3-phosphate transport system substrate-binding protein